MAYALDPSNAIGDIKRKITAAEIGGEAVRSGLRTNAADAEYLQKYGVTKVQQKKVMELLLVVWSVAHNWLQCMAKIHILSQLPSKKYLMFLALKKHVGNARRLLGWKRLPLVARLDFPVQPLHVIALALTKQ